jgi:hypothetical protein
MPRFSTRIRTTRSAGDAFAYLADLENFADWDPGTKSSKQTKGKGPGPGAEYELVSGGAKLTYTVIAYDPPARLRARGASKVVTSSDTISITPDGDGSVVTYEAELNGNGVFKVANPIFSLMFKKLGEGAAKGLCEKLPGTRLS